MSNIIDWFKRHYLQISWFFVGWLALQGAQALANEQYADAALAWFLAATNVFLSRK